MNYNEKKKEQFPDQLTKLRHRIAELEITEHERKRAEEALQESEEQYRTLVEQSLEGIIIAQGIPPDLVFANPAMGQILGYTPEELITLSPGKIQGLVHPEDRTIFFGRFKDRLEGKPAPPRYEVRGIHKDGSVRWLEISSVRTVYREQPAVRATFLDITERRLAEEVLRESEIRLRKLFEAIPESVMVHDEEGNILYINDVGAKRLEWPAEDLVDKNLREIVKPENAALVSSHVRMALTNGLCSFETTYISRTGKHIASEVNERPIELEGKNVILSVARDITEHKRAERQLTYVATHDALTGLPNRVLFNDRFNLALAQAHRRQQKLAVLLLDLDRFKDINDTLGHSVGDQLLRVISKRLKVLLRKSDTLARMGGDEFLFLVPDITQVENVIEVARKIILSFREPFLVEEHELRTTASIGVAIFPDDGADTDTLLKNADIAMYGAKQKGRNNYQRCSSTMKAKTIE